MSTINTTELPLNCVNSFTKCCATATPNLSLDGNSLSLRMIEAIQYDNTPSPSSVASTSTIEPSSTSHQPILSSTLKNDQSLKRRSRCTKLRHQSQMISRRCISSMTKILCQMKKELSTLKRRTKQVEKLIMEQKETCQPIIRIPRLTLDQLATICHNDATKENSSTVESAIENQPVLPSDQRKYPSRQFQLPKKRGRPPLWINNRQRLFDPSRYCSICRYSFTKRSSYLSHMKKFHPEKSTTNTNNQADLSSSDLSEHGKGPSSVVTENLSDFETFEVSKNRPITKQSMKSDDSQTICDICQRSFQINYIQRHRLNAHGANATIPSADAESETHAIVEINSLSNEAESTTAIDAIDIQKANTPLHVNVVEMDASDEPIRFDAEVPKHLVLAVTCLEPYQVGLVEKFLTRFSSNACQTTSIDSRTTHLITNDEKEPLRSPLSMKLIEAIAHHCYCVSFRWLIDCLKSDRILAELPYEIESDNTELEPHFGPQRSRLSPNRHFLFRNTCFMIKCHENADMRITNERLEELITTCGGQIITCVTQRLLDQYQIIVLCDRMYVSERSHNYEQCRALGIQFLSPDWVLESILEYRLKPFTLFEELPL